LSKKDIKFGSRIRLAVSFFAVEYGRILTKTNSRRGIRFDAIPELSFCIRSWSLRRYLDKDALDLDCDLKRDCNSLSRRSQETELCK